MYKGMYIALSGVLAKQRHMDITAQNISNAATTGFKKDRISFKDHMIPVDNNENNVDDGRAMSSISDVVTDFSKGTLVNTGNPLDVAINGEGFFALEDNKFTRNGNFGIDGEGNLVTQDGTKVQGDGGTITLVEGKIDINSNGEIFIDNVLVDRLRVVEFTDKSELTKISDGLFSSKSGGEDVETKISQGYLESSNVEVVKEMVQMIMTLREFEAYQKMIHSFDEATSKVVNELGR